MPDDRDAELAAARADAASVVEDLRAELAAIGEATEARPDDEHDAEGATVGFERARVTALLRGAEAALGRIDCAIERLAAGDEGRCVQCGGPIGTERLHALVGTDRCVACAAAPATGARRGSRG